eukprot:TRINITY_DN25872_c0_g2_i8.p1 TRINITY_DN25872_c0_g2~~TRINITY_DN25872_c0_g2_i8.p1  ORF type:complete len:276 (-),score=45.71 TRINITY_DN25872_c0_g2_i8:63-890(-)
MLALCLLLLCSVVVVSGQGGDTSANGAASDVNCVVINEVVHKPRNNEEDWVELFNSCSEAVNLSGYLIRDSTTATFVLGQGTCVHQILPKSYLLLMRRQNCSFEFGLGGEDSVHLFNTLGDEIDSTAWTTGAAPEGKSWSRLPNGGGPFITTDPTPGEFNGISLVLPDKIVTSIEQVTVVINEAVSKRVELEEDWIELYNYGAEPVNLKGLRLTDKKQAPGDGFYFGEEGCEDKHIIGPGEYLVFEKKLTWKIVGEKSKYCSGNQRSFVGEQQHY